MTGAVHPTDFTPVVALFCTRGMEDFLSNAIKGILQTGVEAGQIHVGCPLNAQSSVESVARSHSSDIQVVSSPELSGNAGRMTAVFPLRIAFIYRDFVEEDTLPPAIDRGSSACGLCGPATFPGSGIRFPISFRWRRPIPSPSRPRDCRDSRPRCAWGFASFEQSKRAIAFLDALIAFRSTQLGSGAMPRRSGRRQQLIEGDVTWLRDIYPLPEMLFLNGLGYRNLLNAGASPCPIEGELLPFVFHANWTVGIENKRKLLAATGTWLARRCSAGRSSRRQRGNPCRHDARDLQRISEPSPLLTVIYPVFDVRGDVDERVRLWTERQDLDGTFVPRHRGG